MNIWGFSFTQAELSFWGILAASFVYQIFFYTHYIAAALGNERREKKKKNRFTDSFLPVSVIICAKNEDKDLQKNLPFFLEQEYPADFEIIVVSENPTEENALLLSTLKQQYKNLKTTFVPDDIKMIVPRKLAITLGVKAAAGEWVLFTCADCMPEDKYWLKHIARNFLPETDMVFAFDAMFKNRKLLNRCMAYALFFHQSKMLGYALRKKPVTGMACNLAMRKSVFIGNKGFKQILSLSEGDLEIIANRYAGKRNTRVETAADSLIWSDNAKSFSEWFYSREISLFVMQQLRVTSIWRLNVETLFRIVFYLSFTACVLGSNSIAAAAAGLLFLVRFIVQCITVNLSFKRYGGQRYYISIITLDIILPFIDLFILIFGKKFKKKFN